ncbi:cardiolipin synthase ClsB [Rhodoferax sp.]|jgi:cardiolipin synthase|uniref:cardiolipin synthase ClsB n=1 Tax=Rhodoferax sp. TaxID=50421 RepID=UPI0027319A82|nr:cardiolipin synthase ClsB [Rhodoferax sp.]MDP1530370.1 cardiolipin synthase ClsB [Rhodoferax sp.]MDP1943284.1 cardiolipin synthase ClsB [Rhodoferax sp.]MDP2442672.1 cardiolipin synthase ClsB [Rhodoferax sp.]MDP3192002.1 cardiolipin synthase ClsB [Rhodoferax sp.]MDP3336467.1 cardiolipin synthase ClsB [Rhodoferax sp.]
MFTAGHQVDLLQGTQEFFPALVQAMDRSVHEIRLETYIFSVEASGAQVAQALERAARRGVKVFVVMDGAGTDGLSPEWVSRFSAAGVAWHIFSPLGRTGFLIPNRWRRLHRKLCVVDGQVAFCGGINVLDDFYDPNHGVLAAPRFDFAVRVTGPLVESAHAATLQFWWRLQATRIGRQGDLAAAWQVLHLANQSDPDAVPAADDSHVAGALAQTRAGLILRDNVRHRTHIERAYRQAIGEAQHDIIISNAYFLPGRKIRRGLVHAAQRGVRVRLLLQGRYEYFMQYHAARMVYGKLLAAGVEITEYQVSFLHAKVAVIDGHWATVGSSNLDPLSLLLAREANVVVDDVAFAQNLQARLEHAMAVAGTRVDPADYAARPFVQRMLDRVAYVIMRGLLFVSGKRY